MKQLRALETLITLVLIGCGAPVACGSKTAPAPVAEVDHEVIRLEPGNPRLAFVKIETIQPTDAAPSVRLTGKVTFDENHTQRVASPIDGRVSKVLVELGAEVKPGQSLVVLTSPHVSELQSEAQKAAQDLGLAEKSLARARKLKEDGAVSEKDAAQAEADYLKAKTESARTEAQLRSLAVSATDPTVSAALHAQIGGIVVDRSILVGQEVRADSAQPLMTISDLSTVWVQADVYEQDLGLVSNGATVKIHVPAYPDEAFTGKVEHVGDLVDPTSRTVKLRCSVPNPDHRLKPEMFAKIELLEAPGKKVLLVPSQAVLAEADGARMIVATQGDVFRERLVTVGPETDGKVRVLSGLRAGERVVTEGAIFVRREMESD